jgi:hypothetical protein
MLTRRGFCPARKRRRRLFECNEWSGQRRNLNFPLTRHLLKQNDGYSHVSKPSGEKSSVKPVDAAANVRFGCAAKKPLKAETDGDAWTNVIPNFYNLHLNRICCRENEKNILIDTRNSVHPENDFVRKLIRSRESWSFHCCQQLAKS